MKHKLFGIKFQGFLLISSSFLAKVVFKKRKTFSLLFLKKLLYFIISREDQEFIIFLWLVQLLLW